MKTKNLTQKLNIYELIGIIIGDGYIRYSTKDRVYYLEITGDAKDEQEYFSEISDLIYSITKKKPKIQVKNETKGKSLKLIIYSKEFTEYLINKLSLNYGNKTFTAEIPKKNIDWKYSRHIIRGIFETDGSLYFSKSKNFKYPTYPRIELTTSSKKLASQLEKILKQKAFKIQTRTRTTDKTTRLYLSRESMLEKWNKEIGFSSMKKYSIYLLWKKYGYYIPRMSYKDRMKLLWERGTAATAVDSISKDNEAEPAAVVQKKATFPGFKSQRSLHNSKIKLGDF